MSRRSLFLGSVFLALAFLLVVYYWVTDPIEASFGERYVDSEIPLLFPFFAIASFKPITLIVYLTFTGVVLLLESAKNRLKDRNTKPYGIALLLVTFATGYEVLWNFFAWFTLWEKQGGVLDVIPNTTHDYVLLPVNFNFATKVIFLVFALCLYTSVFLDRLQKPSR